MKQQKHLFCVCFQVTSPPVWNRKCRLWAAMGQRAVLLLSELLLLLTASRTLLAVSFPEDAVPLDVVDAHCESTHSKWTQQRLGITIAATWLQESTTILNIHFLVTSCICFHHGFPINSMRASVMSSQFHGGTLCSEAGPLATSHSIALTFSWWPRYRTLCSSLAGKHTHLYLSFSFTHPPHQYT